MAQRRMFSLNITDTDAFLDLPITAQCLYFHLGTHGDDEGFVGSPKKIMRSVGCTEADFKVLEEKGYIFIFESGVVVIRDWKLNNILKSDRIHETIYTAEREQLSFDRGNRYILTGTNVEPDWNHSGTNVEPEHNQHNQHIISQRQNNTDDDDSLEAYIEKVDFLRGLSNKVLKYRSDLSDDVIKYGIDSALEFGGKSLKYLKVILDSYIQQGLLTVDAIRQHEAERKGINTAPAKKPLHTLKDYRNGMDYDDWWAWVHTHLSEEFDNSMNVNDILMAINASLSPEEQSRWEWDTNKELERRSQC